MGTVSTFRHGCLQLLLFSTSSLLTWIPFIAGPLAWLCLVNFLELSATYQHCRIFSSMKSISQTFCCTLLPDTLSI